MEKHGKNLSGAGFLLHPKLPVQCQFTDGRALPHRLTSCSTSSSHRGQEQQINNAIRAESREQLCQWWSPFQQSVFNSSGKKKKIIGQMGAF